MVVGKPPLTPPKEGKSEFDVVDELLEKLNDFEEAGKYE